MNVRVKLKPNSRSAKLRILPLESASVSTLYSVKYSQLTEILSSVNKCKYKSFWGGLLISLLLLTRNKFRIIRLDLHISPSAPGTYSEIRLQLQLLQ